MFPYKLLINETNNLIVDAVAGSSEAVEISAGGSLSLLGAIQSQHDILLESAADFQGELLQFQRHLAGYQWLGQMLR